MWHFYKQKLSRNLPYRDTCNGQNDECRKLFKKIITMGSFSFGWGKLIYAFRFYFLNDVAVLPIHRVLK